MLPTHRPAVGRDGRVPPDAPLDLRSRDAGRVEAPEEEQVAVRPVPPESGLGEGALKAEANPVDLRATQGRRRNPLSHYPIRAEPGRAGAEVVRAEQAAGARRFRAECLGENEVK